MTVSVGGEVRCEKTYTMTILPVDQWSGARPYAELLSAYVMPNADLVCRLQAETAKETSDLPFNEAEKIGRDHLDDDATFTCAIDVVRSRESGIRPLSF